MTCRNEAARLRRLVMALHDEIMSMTDDEVLAECRENGEDPESIATSMRELLARAKEDAKAGASRSTPPAQPQPQGETPQQDRGET